MFWFIIIMLILLLFVTSLLFNRGYSSCSSPEASETKRLWIIRHCQKPLDVPSDCCSTEGRADAAKWSYYFSQQFGKKETVAIVAPTFSLKTFAPLCDPKYNPSKSDKCQKSQRMIQTADIMKKTYLPTAEIITTDNCVGYETWAAAEVIDLLSKYDHVIVVWEHNAIPELLNNIGILTDPWPADKNNAYNYLFAVTILMPPRCIFNNVMKGLDINSYLFMFKYLLSIYKYKYEPYKQIDLPTPPPVPQPAQ